MKKDLAVVLFAALFPLACGQVANSDQFAAAAPAGLSSDEQAANELYLNDVLDSAAGSDCPATDEGAAPFVTSVSQRSVEDDIKDERLASMATKAMSELDRDASGFLSLPEFLVGPKKRAEVTEVGTQIEAKITGKMAEDFGANAGNDALLSPGELKALLKSVAPRVGNYRDEKVSGKPAASGQETTGHQCSNPASHGSLGGSESAPFKQHPDLPKD